jgi:hypothetical protein
MAGFYSARRIWYHMLHSLALVLAEKASRQAGGVVAVRSTSHWWRARQSAAPDRAYEYSAVNPV